MSNFKSPALSAMGSLFLVLGLFVTALLVGLGKPIARHCVRNHRRGDRQSRKR